jgi:hypothetical protein
VRAEPRNDHWHNLGDPRCRLRCRP